MVTGIAHHFWQEIVDDRLESTGAAVNYSDILHEPLSARQPDHFSWAFEHVFSPSTQELPAWASTSIVQSHAERAACDQRAGRQVGHNTEGVDVGPAVLPASPLSGGLVV